MMVGVMEMLGVIQWQIQQKMNKSGHRYDKSDHISRIQANLKEMKEEVNEYLKKSNNETIPPILRARHYLILTCINTSTTDPKNQSKETPQIVKDLSSEKLGNPVDEDRFESLREKNKTHSERNKIVKQKRMITGYRSPSKMGEDKIDCLLPNICQLKLDLQEKQIKKARISMEHSSLANEKEEFEDDCYNLPERRYHSIDLNRSTNLFQHGQTINSQGFRVTTRRLQASKSRELINTLRKNGSWYALQEGEGSRQNDAITHISKSSEVEEEPNCKRDRAFINHSNLVYTQRKEAILKRRIEANLKKEKQQEKQQINQQSTSIIRKFVQKSPKIVLKRQFTFSHKEASHSPHIPNIPRIQQQKQSTFCLANNFSSCSPWQQVGPQSYKETSYISPDFY